jgi:hypothetical protein
MYDIYSFHIYVVIHKLNIECYYKENTPFCRKIIINHDHVKQVTENILELNLIKITFVLSFIQGNENNNCCC